MNISDLERQWFAIRVRSGWEESCGRSLRFKGYEEFVPLCKPAPSIHRTKKALPLFPGYVFCRFGQDVRGLIVTTPGVIAVVGYGQSPAPISDEEIIRVQALVNSGQPTCHWPFFQIGERMRITVGPLAGLEGVIVRCKNRYRLIMSIDLLRRSAAVEVQAGWLAGAAALPASAGG